MRELNLSEVKAVSGAGFPVVLARIGKAVMEFVKSSPTTTSAATGATANTSYYVYNADKPTFEDAAKSAATGVVGGTVPGKAPNAFQAAAAGSTVTGFLDKVTSGDSDQSDRECMGVD